MDMGMPCRVTIPVVVRCPVCMVIMIAQDWD